MPNLSKTIEEQKERARAKDYFGNPLEVSDEVAFMQVGYRSLMKGIIKSITEKTVLISHRKTNLCSEESRQEHRQVIKNVIEGE